MGLSPVPALDMALQTVIPPTDISAETLTRRLLNEGWKANGRRPLHLRTNGIESLWSMLSGYVGTYHKLSTKHLQRYMGEFAGRHNLRNADTADMMAALVAGMIGKRLFYSDLIADNGLVSGARS